MKQQNWMDVQSPDQIGEKQNPWRPRPLSSLSRQEQVAIRIKEYIEGNDLRPGDRLPSESWFATELRVGRPLIREALKGLEAVGAVETRKGIGRFVRAFEADAYVRHFTTDILVQGFDERELTETRCLLEIAAVPEVVDRLTDADIVEIQQLLNRMRDRIGRREPYGDEDIGIHRVIMRRTNNRFIAAMLDAIYAMSLVSISAHQCCQTKSHIDLVEHEAIVSAIIARDSVAARTALMRHFETTAERLGFTPRWRDLFHPDVHGDL